MNRILFFLILNSIHLFCYGQGGTWTWVKGSNFVNPPPNIGAVGVSSISNTPDGRYQSIQWTDLNNNFWIFGGVDANTDMRSDLWMYNHTTNTWTWMKGPTTSNDLGIHGTQGISGPNNCPSARGWGVRNWTDLQGRLWMYGGFGYDLFGTYGLLDELWMYDIATNQWTWMKGSSTANIAASYGTLQVPASTNTPGGRYECNTSWTKSDGTLWTFGGQLYVAGIFNDMWKFDISTNNWTWMSGRQDTNSLFNYGVQNVSSPANLPPGRASYTHWQDASDNFYIFGGQSRKSQAANTSHTFNDTWIYNTNTNYWAWIGGSTLLDDTGRFVGLCNRDSNALPPSTYENRTVQTNSCSDIIGWTFGGIFGPQTIGVYNVSDELWAFSTVTHKWICSSGTNIPNFPGSYGTINISASTNRPSSRAGVCLWADPTGDIWMWGGLTVNGVLNDMWRFIPDPNCLNMSIASPILAQLSDSVICPGDSVKLLVSGGYLISIYPSTDVTLIDSTHASLYPTSNTAYNIIAKNSCGNQDTFHLNVTMSNVVNISFNETICAGSTYLFYGRHLSVPGLYIDTLQSTSSCDSIIALNLSVNPPSTSSISSTICAGSSIIFNGQTISSAGTYSDTLSTAIGCDSIVFLNVIIGPATTTNVSQTICSGSSITFNGQTISAAGTFRDTLSAASGCDSIIVLTVAVGPAAITNINQSTCNGSSIIFNGQTISVAGTYRDTLSSSLGCDSIIILTLTTLPPIFSNISKVICSGSSTIFHGQPISSSGSYHDTISAASGCDSIITLILTVAPSAISAISQSICTGSSFVFNGHNISTAGTYRDTLISVLGCDSIIVLTLNIASFLTTSINRNICDGSNIIFNGQSISLAGTYLDTISSVAGCDSIITLTVTASSSSVVDIDRIICDGDTIIFNGNTYTNAGLYADTLTATTGCDSVVRLRLSNTPKPIAGFTIQPTGDSLALGLISVANTAQNYSSILWQLNNQWINLLSDSILPISSAGNYCIKQEAIAAVGCMDTMERCIIVTDDAFIMPNAFSPNGDGINDLFMGSGKGVKSYLLKVFNRWGELVFVSDQLSLGWDGTYKGYIQEPGIYVYVVNVTLQNTKIHLYKGSVTLIR